MRMLQSEYLLQISTAQSTLEQLQSKRNEVESLRKSDPANTAHVRELQKLCLDITITENEIEHARHKLDSETSYTT